MKKKAMLLQRCIIFTVLLPALFISSSWAGQIVTNQERLWAQKILEEEKSLDTIRAQNTLAIYYFRNKTDNKQLNPLQKGLSLMLITDLSKINGIQVVERIKLQALIDEMKLSVFGLTEKNSALRIGKLLGAQQLVGGDFLDDPNNPLYINSGLVDIASTELLLQNTAKGKLAEFFQLEKKILFEIITFLKISLDQEEKELLKKPFSTSMKAILAFFKGIDASDREEYAKAARFYQKALKEDPNLETAQDALQELKDSGYLNNRAKTSQFLQKVKNRTSLTDQIYPEEPIKQPFIPSLSPQVDLMEGVIEFPGNEFP